MPELPEVETVRRGLVRSIVGRRVESARLLRRDVLRTDGRAGPAALLAGGTIAAALRRGKHLAIVAQDGRALGVHLGMTGQLLATRPGASAGRSDHTHARWTLEDGTVLVFRDPRRFGGLWSYPSLDALRADRWADLGPDAMSITARSLAARLARGRRAVKAALLDQVALAGVGNIYADEALFRARVHPRRESGSLTPAELDRLAASIRSVLREALRAGGSTLRDYAGTDGSPGRQQEKHLVYGRGERPCVWCGRRLAIVLVAQRMTVYCETCQGLPMSYPHARPGGLSVQGERRARGRTGTRSPNGKTEKIRIR